VTGRAWYWLVLQLVAVAAGIWAGVWIVDAVTT
jgi:hypothetical protein